MCWRQSFELEYPTKQVPVKYASLSLAVHDDAIKWKHFPRYYPYVRGIHRWPVNSHHNGQWRGALVFSLIGLWINGWVNNGETGGLKRHRTHNDVIVMKGNLSSEWQCLSFPNPGHPSSDPKSAWGNGWPKLAKQALNYINSTMCAVLSNDYAANVTTMPFWAYCIKCKTHAGILDCRT